MEIQKKHVTENDKLKPLNPYAKSKLLIEKYIQKVAKNNLRYIILRYFNVAGTEKKKEQVFYQKNLLT